AIFDIGSSSYKGIASSQLLSRAYSIANRLGPGLTKDDAYGAIVLLDRVDLGNAPSQVRNALDGTLYGNRFHVFPWKQDVRKVETLPKVTWFTWDLPDDWLALEETIPKLWAAAEYGVLITLPLGGPRTPSAVRAQMNSCSMKLLGSLDLIRHFWARYPAGSTL